MVDLVKLLIIDLFEAVSLDYCTFVMIGVRLARLCSFS
jgi:hypothetical protein